MAWTPSPFKQLQELAEKCLGDLGRDQLRPQDVWLIGDPEGLEEVKRELERVIQRLEFGLRRLAALEDERFASVLDLDEWQAIEEEVPAWKKQLAALRPAADLEHVKGRLISIRTRFSELVDSLVVRSAVRDPGHRAANTLEAVSSIAVLLKERELRDVGLGLLEGVTWEETLEGGVADWSMSFGPQHRIVLEQFCEKLLHLLDGVKAAAGGSPALAHLTRTRDEVGGRLRKIYERLLEVPNDKVDAGIASDFHYMASLVKKIVDAVTSRHGEIIAHFAGRQLPPALTHLFRLLHLQVPRVRRPTTPIHLSSMNPLTREELQAELGRRLVDKTEDEDP